MAKCELAIVLEHEDNSYQIGDVVRGQVKVNVTQHCEFQAVFIKKFWQTHGKGNEDEGDLQKIVLFKGDLPLGEYSYPFEFELENGPITYQGKNFGIQWRLEARADIDWAIDPKASIPITIKANSEQPIKLTQAPIENEIDFVEDLRRNLNLDHPAIKSRVLPIAMSIFALYSFIIIVLAIANIRTNAYDSLITNILFWVLPGFLLFKLCKPFIAQSKLGEVTVTIEEKDYHCAERVTVKLNFTPPKSITINGIKARLQLSEDVVQGSGKNKSHLTHQHVVEEKTLVENRKLPANIPFGQSAYLALPTEVMHNFKSPSNKLSWQLVLDIDIPFWPDWQLKQTIQVKS